MRTLDVMLALVRYEILGQDIPPSVGEAISPERLASLYKLSSRHDVAHIVAEALRERNIIGENDEYGFTKQRNLALCRHTQMQYEYSRIVGVLERLRIPYMPLKGAIIRQYYPRPWMRTSCDIDILVKAEDLERAKNGLISELGYNHLGDYTSHDITLASPSGVRLELHHSLCDSISDYGASVLSDIWQKTVIKEDTEFCHIMTNEVFYFYHIAHMARHFSLGGCGVRSVIDLWILNSSLDLNKNDCDFLLESCGLLKFAEAMENLSRVWLDGERRDESISEIEEYIIKGGVYGNAENRIKVQQTKAGGHTKYLWSRIFISTKELKRKYPSLEKKPYLIPIYHIARWFRPIFNSKSKKKALKDIERGRVAKQSEEKTRELLKVLGL